VWLLKMAKGRPSPIGEFFGPGHRERPSAGGWIPLSERVRKRKPIKPAAETEGHEQRPKEIGRPIWKHKGGLVSYHETLLPNSILVTRSQEYATRYLRASRQKGQSRNNLGPISEATLRVSCGSIGDHLYCGARDRKRSRDIV